MHIREFQLVFIEGYLLEDLRSMAAVSAPGRYGSVVYPMIATALAGVELLGNLVQPVGPFRTRGGAAAFEHFWCEYLYAQPERRRLCSPVYQLVRHGLAHVFLPKPGISTFKDGDRARHLTFDVQGALQVDALVLADDLRAAYEGGVKPILNGDPARALPGSASVLTMQARLDEMIAEYAQQSTKQGKAFAACAPVRQTASLPVSVNSPTASNAINAATAGLPFLPDPTLPEP